MVAKPPNLKISILMEVPKCDLFDDRFFLDSIEIQLRARQERVSRRFRDLKRFEPQLKVLSGTKSRPIHLLAQHPTFTTTISFYHSNIMFVLSTLLQI